MARIFDCFMFFDEFDALEIRVAELGDFVEHFVLVEASTTFSGEPKPFRFAERADDFPALRDRVTVVHVTDLPRFENRWIAEYFQRNALLRGLDGATRDDIVLISDCDEIPSAHAVQQLPELLAHEGDIVALGMATYYYALNLRSDERIFVARATHRATLDFVTPHEVRGAFTTSKLSPAGWHFSYLAPACERAERIQRKAHAFAHGEFDVPQFTSDEHLDLVLANDELWWTGDSPAGPELLHRVPVDDSFPSVVASDPERWRDFVVDGAGDPSYERRYRWRRLQRDARLGARFMRRSLRRR